MNALIRLAKRKLIAAAIKINNAIVDIKKRPRLRPSGLRELDEVIAKSQERTVINDHLPTLFIESLRSNPRLIVELGVETGQSTFAFERAARLSGAKLVSVDCEDCSNACHSREWLFVQNDDLKFAKIFKIWCEEHSIIPEIDILFIDTDHSYEQTIKEIECWFPYLSKRAKVFFHDSNTKLIYKRKDGSIGSAPDYKRGVMRALEKYFQDTFNEEKDFIAFRKGWLIRHYTNCNGLTILEKLIVSEAK